MKFKKTISVILSAAICLSFAACAGKGNGNTPPVATGTVTESDMHLYAGGLHKINVGVTDNVFVRDGVTEYTVVIPADADVYEAQGAGYISRYVKESTGAEISVINDDAAEWSAEAEYIAINSEKLFTAAGLEMPADDIGQSGYYIKNCGKSVFITSKGGWGARNGALGFMRQLVGLEFFSGDSAAFNDLTGRTVMLPDYDVTDAPDIPWNTVTNMCTSATQAALRLTNTGDIFMNVEGGGTWHNTLYWLPVSKWAAEHPDWYSSDRRELCYTAHGNPKELDLMVQECIKKAIASVDANPTKTTLTFTQMDGGPYCTCKACTDHKQAYGGADSAALIKFVNRVADGLKAHLEAQAAANGAETRKVDLIFFAYNQTTNPPVKKEGGEIVPFSDDVICRDNVGVYYAPIGLQFNESLYSPVNASGAETVRGWNVLTKHFYVWYYDTNFFEYLYPFNTWGALPETYRLLAENNTFFILNLGQFNQGTGNTAFASFKEYLNAELRWDCNQSYGDLTNRFFNGYFKEAAEPMRRYFDELTAHIKYLEATYPTGVNGAIYHHPTDQKFWPKRTLDQWLGYIDEAYEAIAPLKETDPVKYETLSKNICLESIFIRYARLTIYTGLFSSADLQAERVAFKADCDRLGISRHLEGGSISTVYQSWGL